MAWAEQLPNGNWRGFWRDASGIRRSASLNKETGRPFTGPRGEEAAKKYAIGREAVARDNGPQNDGRGLTWGQWRDRWLSERRVEPSTKKGDTGRIEKHLNRQWAGRNIKRIDRRAVQNWVNDLADDPDLSAATVARIYYLFSASMKAAVKAGQLAASPCQLIDLPTPSPGQERFLTKSEVAYIHYFLDDPLAADAILMLPYTGLRFGELVGLHWSRVDLNNATLTVAEVWDTAAGRIKGYPKSKKPRVIPLASVVLDILAHCVPDTGTCGLPHAKGSTCTSSLVLPTGSGRPIDYANLRNREWTVALELAGIPHARLHDLRHTYASWLAQAGVPIHVIRELMGHKTVTTTERYSHIGSEQYGRVLSALD
jgi:integrase